MVNRRSYLLGVGTGCLLSLFLLVGSIAVLAVSRSAFRDGREHGRFRDRLPAFAVLFDRAHALSGVVKEVQGAELLILDRDGHERRILVTDRTRLRGSAEGGLEGVEPGQWALALGRPGPDGALEARVLWTGEHPPPGAPR